MFYTDEIIFRLDDKQTNALWFQYIHTFLGERIFSIISGLVIVDLGTGEKIWLQAVMIIMKSWNECKIVQMSKHGKL